MRDTVHVQRDGAVTVVVLDRPEAKNAVDPATARRLAEVFVAFDHDDDASVAVLTGAHGTFCAGADLKAVAAGDFERPGPRAAPFEPHASDAPLGPSYLRLTKPVIAAIAGHAVAGGLELALWCDLRVIEEDAVLGVFCRRWGVPLIDGGTVRLPRLIGHGHAMDLILTGRPVSADEAQAMGLANRVVPAGQARSAAVELAHQLARFPQVCLRNDRASAYAQWDLSFDEALAYESRRGDATLRSREAAAGAARFVAGRGRGGRFDDL